MARQRENTPLGWFLVVSLLLNHAVVLPVAYHLLTKDRSREDRKPEAVEVEFVEPPALPDEPEEVVPPRRVKARPVKVAALRPTKKKERRKKKLPPKQPEKKKPEEKKQPKKKKQPVEPPPPPEPMRLKMVEVNNPESDKPNPNARFLSDRNRHVKKETRARHTNLVKDSRRPRPMTKPAPRRAAKPGAEKPRVAETRKQKARKVHPLLAMRPRPGRAPVEEVKRLAPSAKGGQLAAPRKAQRGRRPRLNLDYRSHDRIYGKEARRQRELARLAPSRSRGRASRWKRIRSALENFIPEVQPGNQTALGTRANPFALYIARMHRRIHRLWGYGFLVDLDLKSDSHPMNNMKLWTMIEVVVAPNGKVAKATIVKHSGYLPYDVAALNTIFTSSPYPATPRNIRSADGKVYMHWRFHRDQRQCGTFGVDPYVLTKPPKGPVDGDMSEVGRAGGKGPRGLRRLNRKGSGVSRTHSHNHGHRHSHKPAPRARAANKAKARARQQQVQRAAQAAARRMVDPKDPAARRVAAALVKGFERGDAKAMARTCRLPFLSRGRKVATSRSQLASQFADLISENKQRKATRLELMTVMTARDRLNRLPAGAAHGEQMLVGMVKLGKVPVRLILQRRGGKWQVVGLNR